MSWYDEYKDQWREIIETVAAEERLTTQMVEKDTRILRRKSRNLT